jgi:hypothetical protein
MAAMAKRNLNSTSGGENKFAFISACGEFPEGI